MNSLWGLMRAEAGYKESLRDGRDVWVLGEGAVRDVTTDPSTSAMVDECAAWYDRHFNPEASAEANTSTPNH